MSESKYVKGVNEENMDKFLAALRSGEFEQVDGRLCQVGPEGEVEGFCCLGVGSELAHQDKDFGLVKEVVQYSGRNARVMYDMEQLLAPGAMLDWLGIPKKNRDSDLNGGYNIKFFRAEEVIDPEELHEYGYDGVVTATELNDDMNFPFDRIADVFENEFKSGK